MVHTMRPETQSSSHESLPVIMKALDSYLAPRRVRSSFLSIGDNIDRMMCLTFHLCLLAFRFFEQVSRRSWGMHLHAGVAVRLRRKGGPGPRGGQRGLGGRFHRSRGGCRESREAARELGHSSLKRDSTPESDLSILLPSEFLGSLPVHEFRLWLPIMSLLRDPSIR